MCCMVFICIDKVKFLIKMCCSEYSGNINIFFYLILKLD